MPAPVAFTVSPFFTFPLNPGAVIWHDGTGFPFGVSENAAIHRIGTGPAISAVAGWGPSLPAVACSEVTWAGLVRVRWVLDSTVSVKTATVRRQSNEMGYRVFIAPSVRLQTLHPSIRCGNILHFKKVGWPILVGLLHTRVGLGVLLLPPAPRASFQTDSTFSVILNLRLLRVKDLNSHFT